MVSGETYRQSMRQLSRANRTLTGHLRTVMAWLVVSATFNVWLMIMWAWRAF
jgi:hypothetical protein